MVLSEVFEGKIERKSKDYDKDREKSSSSNHVLVIVLIVLALLLVIGAILAYVLLGKYKSKPNRIKLDAKETSLAMVNNNKEKMLTSTATQGGE